MRKMLVLASCLLLLSLCAYSQAVNIGLRGGLSIPNVVAGGDNPLSQGYSSRLAGAGGIFAELDLNKTFSLRLGAEYSGQGGKRNGIQAMSTNQLISSITAGMDIANSPAASAILEQMPGMLPGIFYADVQNTAKFDYLMVPLTLQAGKDVGKSWRLYAGAGPFISFLLSAKQISEGHTKLYTGSDKSKTLLEYIPEEFQQLIAGQAPELAYIFGQGTEFGTEDITNDLKKVNAGVQGNVGLAYQIHRHKIFLEVGGNYGFITVQKDKSNGSNSIGSGSVMLGYAIRLGE
ncbi:MAG: PorT family protein [Candidatus Symbiothrix sp.]|jgi:hypothetical protein|nr:PorT family protein [Candidatus Symbiothrix sp.]